jgi:hypothetical protein
MDPGKSWQGSITHWKPIILPNGQENDR